MTDTFSKTAPGSYDEETGRYRSSAGNRIVVGGGIALIAAVLLAGVTAMIVGPQRENAAKDTLNTEYGIQVSSAEYDQLKENNSNAFGAHHSPVVFTIDGKDYSVVLAKKDGKALFVQRNGDVIPFVK